MHPTVQFFNLSNQNIFFPNSPTNKACPERIPQIFVHFEISRLQGGLGTPRRKQRHFIKSDHHSSFDPDFNTADVSSFPRRATRSAIRLFLIDETVVQRFHNYSLQFLQNPNKLCEWSLFGFCDGYPVNLRFDTDSTEWRELATK